jgi:hypothetical protein
MPDDDKPARPFPVEVTVNGVRVTVMLKPGTAVMVAEKNHHRAADAFGVGFNNSIMRRLVRRAKASVPR